MIRLFFVSFSLICLQAFAKNCDCRLALDNPGDGPLVTFDADINVGGILPGKVNEECKKVCNGSDKLQAKCNDFKNSGSFKNTPGNTCDPLNKNKIVRGYSDGGARKNFQRTNFVCGKLMIETT